MKISRRDFLHAGCTIAAASLVPTPFQKAQAFFHRGAAGQSFLNPLATQRPVLNVNLITSPADYAFINRLQQGSSFPGPAGTNFNSVLWNQNIDTTTGYPNTSSVAGHGWGGGFPMAAASNFAGPYVMSWTGGDATFANSAGATTFTEANLVTPGTATFTNGNANIAFTNSFDSTVVAGGRQQIIFTTSAAGFTAKQVYYVISTGLSGTNMQVSATAGGAAIIPNAGTTATVNGTYTRVSNGKWQNVAGVNPYIVFNISGTTVPTGNNFQINTLGTNGFATGFQYYEQADEADLLAGKIFRVGFKQPIVSFNPGAIRFMNWLGGNTDTNVRFENRTLPSYGGYTGVNWVASPLYGQATASGAVNQYTLAAVSTGARQTPVSMTHGEIVTCQMGTAGLRFGSHTVSNVTQANPGVASCTSHGFSTGDQIVIFMTRNSSAQFSGMVQLNLFPVTITVIDANSFSIGIDTTGFTAWDSTASGGTAFAEEWVTLNVGGRGAFSMVGQDGNSIVSRNQTISLDDYRSFTFDKTIAAQGDGAGGWVMGAWVTSGGQSHGGDTPIEICVALVNEVNAMSVAQGFNNPVHMWMNLPVMSMLSMDPDYSAGSNWAINAVEVALNGANGFAGLNGRCGIVVEYSNEIWNNTVVTQYTTWRDYQRWNAAPLSQYQDMYALRSTCAMRDIQTVYPIGGRVKYIFGVWNAGGITPGGFGANYERCFGSSTPGHVGNYYTTDPLVTGGGWGTPMSNHDGICIAPYIDVPGTYMSPGTGTGTFTDDSAMYAGTSPYSSPNQAQAITNFVAQASINITNLLALVGPGTNTFATVMQGVSPPKVVVNYEGGADWLTRAGNTYEGHLITAADQIFLQAILDSSQWSTAQLGFFTSFAAITGCFLPAIYIHISTTITDQQWAYCTPDSYATISGTPTEGAALTVNNAFWVAGSTRNQALPN
jgi:hypothetical protein